MSMHADPSTVSWVCKAHHISGDRGACFLPQLKREFDDALDSNRHGRIQVLEGYRFVGRKLKNSQRHLSARGGGGGEDGTQRLESR